jgi:hypothetical protein
LAAGAFVDAVEQAGELAGLRVRQAPKGACPRLSDDMDPELNEKVMALAGKKFEMYPRWAKMFTAIPDLRGGG